jgi:hypothetical protein
VVGKLMIVTTDSLMIAYSFSTLQIPLLACVCMHAVAAVPALHVSSLGTLNHCLSPLQYPISDDVCQVHNAHPTPKLTPQQAC